MRLSDVEKKSIIKAFNRFSKSGMQLYLFGSRVDETKKGGDIDLLVVLGQGQVKSDFKQLDFIVELKKQIGERKIDVTLALESELITDLFLVSVMDTSVKLTSK